MFSIYDGRTQFYQWDTNQKLIVNDDSITQVHFANCLCANARVCDVYTHDDDFGGIRLVEVPNELLTENSDVKVWGYDGNATKHCATFEVVKRTKPADYVYTKEELKQWEKLYNLALQLSELYSTTIVNVNYLENDIAMLMDLPISLYTAFANLCISGSGTATPYNKRNLHRMDSVTLRYETDYKEPKEFTIDFKESFTTGYIYWTEGFYNPTRKIAVLDTSKLEMCSNTNNNVKKFGVRTTLAEQGINNIINTGSTKSNALTYTASPMINYRFNINNGYIYIYLKDELTGEDNENLEKAKQILEGTEFYYICEMEKITFEPMPGIIGAEATDDSWIYITIETGNDNIRAATTTLDYRVRPGASTQYYVDNDLQDELSAIYERLDELEANL